MIDFLRLPHYKIKYQTIGLEIRYAKRVSWAGVVDFIEEGCPRYQWSAIEVRDHAGLLVWIRGLPLPKRAP